MGKKKAKKILWRRLSLGEVSGNEDDQSASGSAEAPKSSIRRKDRKLVHAETHIYNDEEYTKIQTPRQDLLFKKGYLSKPRKQEERPTSEDGAILDEQSIEDSYGEEEEVEDEETTDEVVNGEEGVSGEVYMDQYCYMDSNGIYYTTDVPVSYMAEPYGAPGAVFGAPAPGGVVLQPGPYVVTYPTVPVPWATTVRLQSLDWYNPRPPSCDAQYYYLLSQPPVGMTEDVAVPLPQEKPQEELPQETTSPSSPLPAKPSSASPTTLKCSSPSYVYPGYSFGPSVNCTNGPVRVPSPTSTADVTASAASPTPIATPEEKRKRKKKKRHKKKTKAAINETEGDEGNVKQAVQDNSEQEDEESYNSGNFQESNAAQAQQVMDDSNTNQLLLQSQHKLQLQDGSKRDSELSEKDSAYEKSISSPETLEPPELEDRHYEVQVDIEKEKYSDEGFDYACQSDDDQSSVLSVKSEKELDITLPVLCSTPVEDENNDPVLSHDNLCQKADNSESNNSEIDLLCESDSLNSQKSLVSSDAIYEDRLVSLSPELLEEAEGKKFPDAESSNTEHSKHEDGVIEEDNAVQEVMAIESSNVERVLLTETQESELDREYFPVSEIVFHLVEAIINEVLMEAMDIAASEIASLDHMSKDNIETPVLANIGEESVLEDSDNWNITFTTAKDEISFVDDDKLTEVICSESEVEECISDDQKEHISSVQTCESASIAITRTDSQKELQTSEHNQACQIQEFQEDSEYVENEETTDDHLKDVETTDDSFKDVETTDDYVRNVETTDNHVKDVETTDGHIRNVETNNDNCRDVETTDNYVRDVEIHDNSEISTDENKPEHLEIAAKAEDTSNQVENLEGVSEVDLSAVKQDSESACSMKEDIATLACLDESERPILSAVEKWLSSQALEQTFNTSTSLCQEEDSEDDEEEILDAGSKNLLVNPLRAPSSRCQYSSQNNGSSTVFHTGVLSMDGVGQRVGSAYSNKRLQTEHDEIYSPVKYSKYYQLGVDIEDDESMIDIDLDLKSEGNNPDPHLDTLRSLNDNDKEEQIKPEEEEVTLFEKGQAIVPFKFTRPESEIVVHAAEDETSECGSEDVDLLPHRYLPSQVSIENKVSLAVELLKANGLNDELKLIPSSKQLVAVHGNNHIMKNRYGNKPCREIMYDSGIGSDESGDEKETYLKHRIQGISYEDMNPANSFIMRTLREEGPLPCGVCCVIQ